MEIENVKAQAKAELEAEAHREAVDAYKIKLRKQKWYHKLFPFKIVLIRKEKI